MTQEITEKQSILDSSTLMIQNQLNEFHTNFNRSVTLLARPDNARFQNDLDASFKYSSREIMRILRNILASSPDASEPNHELMANLVLDYPMTYISTVKKLISTSGLNYDTAFNLRNTVNMLEQVMQMVRASRSIMEARSRMA